MRKNLIKAKWLIMCACFVVGMLVAQNSFSQAKHHLLQGKHSKVTDSLVVTADTSVPVLINKIENYSYTIDHTNFVFRNPLNLALIYPDLNLMEKRLDGFKERLERKGKQMNLRSINSSTILLKEIAFKLTGYKNILFSYHSQLTESNAKVKKIINDPVLKTAVDDSVLQEQLNDLLNEGMSLDSLEAQMMGRVNILLNHVSITLLQAEDIISDMGYLLAEKKISMWSPEDAPLFEARPAQYAQSLPAIIAASLERSQKIIAIYLSGKWNVFTATALVFIFILAWVFSNLRRVKRLENHDDLLVPVNFLRRNVLVCCLFGLFTYSPFFFANPPMSYLHLNEALRIILLGWLLYPFIAKGFKEAAIILFILWFAFAFDDLLLDSAFGERWILILLALGLTITCIWLVRATGPFFRLIGESPATKAILFFSLSLTVISMGFNLTGRLSLARICGVTAIQAIVVGLTLKVFSTIALEAVYLQFKSFARLSSVQVSAFIELSGRLLRYFWPLAIIAWIVSLSRNLSLYDDMVSIVYDFISRGRVIGSMVFTVKSILIFIFIIWLSVGFSSLINFFFGLDGIAKSKKKGRLGSMMLLIRLTIWILGFLIGVSAAGIPLDKLSIMIGAFGVGIGFGLQNIVNNLVSGVIIAFERPIQIGDFIEVSNKSGTVKEIGVRSSKIKSAEGADIIIPNGDLLSQQLINWTLQDNSRRLDFLLTLASPVDIEKVKSLLCTELSKRSDILLSPGPSVNLQDFQTNAVVIKILWWIPDLTKANSVRSAVMQDVYELLSREGIQFEK